MRVGLNLIFLGERAGGVGRYARELPGALLSADPDLEIHVFVSAETPEDLREEPWSGSVRWARTPIRMSGAPTHLPVEYLLLPALAAARGLDVLHSPANTGPTRTPPGVASVISVMDLIWLHRPSEWEASPRVHRTMRRRVGRAVGGADRIFAISQAGADDLVETLDVPRARVQVTPLGVHPPARPALDERELRAQLQLGDARVLLCVAQKRPYKNLGTLIDALPSLPDDVMLVMPGSPTPYEAELRGRADRLGVADRVRFPDWLTEEQLEGLYACSSAFVLPSLMEGFGLPVLEAMVRGVPVACSQIPALSEVAGDAALPFDPERQEEVTAAIARLLDDHALAARLAQIGPQRAAAFAWKRTGEASLSGYRQAIADRAGGARRLAAGR